MCKGHVVAKSGARSEDVVENEAETRAHGLVGHDQVWGRGRRAGFEEDEVSGLRAAANQLSFQQLFTVPHPITRLGMLI